MIVPVYNDEKYLEKCLESIFKSNYSDFEVIVVNDNSTDNSLNVAKRFPCRIIDLKTNKGVANARNVGAEAAEGDILLFFDSDVVLEEDTLLNFAKAHENPDIKIYQCQIHYCSLTPGFASQVIALHHNYLLSKMVPDTSYIQSFAFSIDKAVFFKIGGFNTDFKSAGGEEFEIGEIILLHNYKMLLDQSFYVHHHFPDFKTRFKKLFKRSYIYGKIVLRRNFKLDKGYGTLKEGINAMLSLIGILAICASLFFPHTILIFFITVVIHILFDRGLYINIIGKRGIFFFLRSIPLIYLWYLSMGMGIAKAGLAHYLLKAVNYLKTFNFLFSKTPPYIIFFVTDKCNARCRHCFNWEKVQNPKLAAELTLSEIKRVSASMGRLKYMTYGGGEPSIREDIVEITQVFCKNNYLEMLNFITNGFDTKKVVDKIKRILRTCPDMHLTVSFSIDGIEEQHDKIRNMPGGFKKEIKSIDEIRKLQEYYPKLKILATTVYSKFNKDNIFEIIDFITGKMKLEMVLSYVRGDTSDKNAKDVDIDTYIAATKRVMEMNLKNSKKRDIVRAIDNLCFKLIAKTKMEKKSVIHCVAGKKLLELGSDGTISPCEMKVINFGNVRDYDYDVKKIIATRKAENFFKFLEKGDCYCTWECAMKNNIVYSIQKYPSLFFEWVKQFAIIPK